MRRLRDLLRTDRGATSVEYALICALIFVTMLGAVNAFGKAAIRMWYNVSTNSVAVL
jgi:pilus assembly protein Flp/PilA